MTVLVLFLAFLSAPPAAAAVSFNRDIRPIMSDTCFRCHGPDRSSRMAGLRLDLRDEAIKKTASGVTPIVPGKPEESAIVQRVFSTNAARVMPPKAAHKDLTDKQKTVIRQWVAEGANYEGHWAYQPVRPPEVPAIAGATISNPIDAFIQQRLQKEGLKPSPPAARRTQIRRVTFDLTGLPPTPEEVAAFLNDKSPDAYAKLVDRLLASPRYAEKQAMHWLDSVRYADTCGFHGDNLFPIWPYRDYVLRAFRDNKPFDVFTREQLAGDLIPGGGTEQKVASAYNRLNRTSAEGGIQPKEYLAKYGADRVRTTASVWLGSTMGCAECHDHKFDPFASRDFYALKAFFADVKETGLVPDRGPKAWGSQLAMPSDEQRARKDELEKKLEQARMDLAARTQAMADKRAEWEKATLAAYEAGTLAWRFQRPVAAIAQNGASLKVYNDEPIDFESYTGASLQTAKKAGNGIVIVRGPNPDNETYTVTLKPGEGSWTALGLEVVADELLPGIRVARGSDRLVVTEVEADLGGRRIQFSLASASFSGVSLEYHAMSAIDGNSQTGWGIATYGENRNLFLALRFAEKVTTDSAAQLTVRIRQDSAFRRATIGRFRLALSAGEHSWPEPEEARRGRVNGLPNNVLNALKKAADKRTAADNEALDTHFAWASGETLESQVEIARLDAELGLLDAAIPRVVVAESVSPEPTRVLPRGNWMDDSGDVVEPAIPGFLGKLPTNGPATRLDLANWLISRDNPLTPRVFVNRMWRQFFGTGLSKVLEDVGSQGELPTHPELLDWLAAGFVKDWDVKRLLRTIVTSYTYQQSSHAPPLLAARDPDNRLLARQSRYRVDAESVHDVALLAAGLLTDKFGGPSVRPYQPEGYLSALNFPKRDYSASRDGDLYRRGVYTIWQRTFLHPTMQTFDAPTREECTVNRVNSNTPLQALVLLNDPIFVEAARVLAQNAMEKGGKSLNGRIDYAFQRALNRKATAAERRTLTALYQKALSRYKAAPADARDLL
ncbi:MAG: PSD1 domain-containing protein [Acidobacteria bacterium]|nr:PSD1 domain-containing protein [Acidobacteriota bacterium]